MGQASIICFLSIFLLSELPQNSPLSSRAVNNYSSTKYSITTHSLPDTHGQVCHKYPWPGTTSALVSVPTAMIKHQDHKQLGEEAFTLLTRTSRQQAMVRGSQGRDLGGTRRQEPIDTKANGGALLTALLLMAWSYRFLIAPKATSSAWHHPQWPEPSQINPQENVPQASLGTLSQLRFPVLKWS